MKRLTEILELYIETPKLGGASVPNRKARLQADLRALGKRIRFGYGAYLVGLAALFCLQTAAMFHVLGPNHDQKAFAAATGISMSALLALISRAIKQWTTISFILALSSGMEEKGLENTLRILIEKY